MAKSFPNFESARGAKYREYGKHTGGRTDSHIHPLIVDASKTTDGDSLLYRLGAKMIGEEKSGSDKEVIESKSR